MSILMLMLLILTHVADVAANTRARGDYVVVFASGSQCQKPNE